LRERRSNNSQKSQRSSDQLRGSDVNEKIINFKNSSEEEVFSLKNSWLILSWRAFARNSKNLYITMNGDFFEKEMMIAASFLWKVNRHNLYIISHVITFL
jgi:hypothetical protein